jgi:hypothetical protein
MERQTVDSTDIANVGYDPASKQLEVEFKRSPGKIYVYDNVPSIVHRDFLKAHSPGSFFHANIKGKFSFTTRLEVKS